MMWEGADSCVHENRNVAIIYYLTKGGSRTKFEKKSECFCIRSRDVLQRFFTQLYQTLFSEFIV
jgi:hypothetical protein